MRLFLILLFFPIKIFSQDIEGVWTGTIYNDTTKKYIPYEIAISETKGKYSGYSHTTFTGENNRQETGVKSLKIKRRNNKIIIEDNDLIYNNYAEPPAKGVRQYSELNVMQSDSGLLLIGVFNTNRTKEYSSVTGTIHLNKKLNIEQTKLIKKLNEMKLSNELSFNQTKKEKENIIAVTNANVLQSASSKKQASSSEKPGEEVEPMLIAIKEDTVIYKADIAEAKDFTPDIKTKKQDPTRDKEDVVKVLPPEIKKPIFSLPKKHTVPVPELVKKQIAAASGRETKTIPSREESKTQINPQQKEKIIAATVTDSSLIKPKTVKPFLAQFPKPLQSKIPASNTGISFEKLSGRTIETIRTVNFKSDSLVLTLYDNGVVDGDTVTVILNGKIIMPNQGLSTKAISKTIYLTPDLGDSLQLIMYAENLGSIPPNTGLLIIQDGEERYEIRFSGDLQKNSAILLKRSR